MSAETQAPETAGGRRALTRAAGFLLLAGAAAALWWLFFVRPFESTDDAYVAGNQVRIAARVNGTVKEILVDDTDQALAGQVLLRLDSADATLALEKARADLANATRLAASRTAERDRLAAVVDMRAGELTMNSNNYARRLRLKTGQSVTAEEVERYREQTAIAEAALAAARHDLETARRLVGTGPLDRRPEVRLAANRLREAWLELDRCEVRSPVAGQVARRTVQVGAQVTPQTPLMAVAPLDRLWVEANFKESQLPRLKPGQKARVKVDFYGGRVVHPGRVAGLGAGTGGVFSLFPPENATGNWIKVVQRVPVRIELEPAALAEAPLRLGLSAHVEILAAEPAEPAPATPRGGPLFAAAALNPDPAEMEAEIAAIIAANSGGLAGQPAGTGEPAGAP